MSDFRKALDTHVSDADWQLMSQSSGQSVHELKESIIPALEAYAQGDERLLAQMEAQEGMHLNLTNAIMDGDCASQSFEISLFKIIGLKGELKLCGTSASDWTAELKICLIVAGSSVWCTSYTFNPHNVGVCFSPSVGLAKADICFSLEIRHDKACLNIKGKACVWGLGWHCGSFDKTPFCIPLP